MSDPATLPRQVALLYRNVPVGQAISVFNATLLAWLWHAKVGTASAGAWWLGAAAVALARLLLRRAYARASLADIPAKASLWLCRARQGAAAAGVVWGIGALLFMLGSDTVQQIFSAFVMAGMVAGAVPILAADRIAFRAYAWPIVLTTALAALGTDALHITFSLMALIFLLGSTRSADHFHQTLMESLRLEHEKDALVAKLESAKQAAEQSNRAKTEFLANISHELRTPMNCIMGMADLLAMEDVSPTQREFLTHQRDAAEELLALINNLIELSALEAGYCELRPHPFALADLLPALLASAARKAQAKGLEFRHRADERLPEVVVGDIERLRKIIGHLADNAVKFTDRGHIEITAALQATAAGSVKIEFVVADTGAGIPADKIQAIFEPFTQVDGSSTRRHAGSGIGLPICRRLTELMHGELTVESGPGTGSVFRLSLPFALPVDDSQPSIAEGEAEARADPL